MLDTNVLLCDSPIWAVVALWATSGVSLAILFSRRLVDGDSFLSNASVVFIYFDQIVESSQFIQLLFPLLP